MRLFLIAAAATALIFTLPAAAQQFTPEQKEELGAFIKSYLVENPDAVVEALNAYQRNQQAMEQKKFEQGFAEKREEIIAGAPVAGNPKGDVTIIEFFDYNCGYCRKAVEDVIGILEQDKNVKFVFRDMPILSSVSNDASRWALAADKQGKYYEYHVALMKNTSGFSPAFLEKTAADLGLDVEKMRKDAQSKEVRDQIEKNLTMARGLGIQGTPAFIIGDRLSPGYMGLDAMKAVVEEVRKKGGE